MESKLTNPPYVIGFYGYSGEGKTTLIERLVSELISKKKKVAVIKQSGHQVNVDQKGTDTQRFSMAGANPVILSTITSCTFFYDQALDIKDIINLVAQASELDLVIVESANVEKMRKIRLGEIPERQNTIWTYNNNFNELLELIDKEMKNV